MTMLSKLTLFLCLTFVVRSAAAEVIIERINPDGMHKPDAYSQLVTVSGLTKLAYLGGKAGLREDGTVPETLAEQSQLIFEKIDIALNAAGARREDVLDIQVYIVDLDTIDPTPVYDDITAFFPKGHKPTSMVIGVSALAVPGMLVEINAVAVIREE